MLSNMTDKLFQKLQFLHNVGILTQAHFATQPVLQVHFHLKATKAVAMITSLHTLSLNK